MARRLEPASNRSGEEAERASRVRAVVYRVPVLPVVDDYRAAGDAEYVRASLAHVPGDHSKAIAKKLERQAVLYDTSKRLTFILTEQAVRWPFLPPAAMAMQVDRLASISLLPNIRLGVIPLEGHMPVGPLNTFTVYDTRIVTVETQTGAMVFRDHRDVSAYLDEFAVYEGLALFGDQCRERLSEWADRFRS